MVNIDGKSHMLNFQRSHFLMAFLWHEGPYVKVLFLVREAAEFPIVLRSYTQSVYCNVASDKLGKLFFVENFMSLNIAILMILFCENDKRVL